MPKRVNELTDKQVRELGPGFHAVGGVIGLYIRIKGGAKSWVLRILINGRRADYGLGSYPTVTLSQARAIAREYRQDIDEGLDPRARRQAARQAHAARTTFKQAALDYLSTKATNVTGRTRAQAEQQLQDYVFPVIGRKPVESVEMADVLRILKPIWGDKHSTAVRVRSRIAQILDWARVQGLREGDNPAAWAGNLEHILPPGGGEVEHRPAVAIDEAPAFLAALRDMKGNPARALEFTMYTAARTVEARGARWTEIKNGLWQVPAVRMKNKKTHRVPLPRDVLNWLEDLPKTSPYLFPGPSGRQMGPRALRDAMRRVHDRAGPFLDPETGQQATPHGLRSTFSDWAGETTDYPRDMVELALSHKVSNAVEAAYRRGDMMEKRRQLMADWFAFLRGGE